MPIYADKKNGQLTGRWRVELQVNFKRLRARVDTLEEAKALEVTWKTSEDPWSSASPRKDQIKPSDTIRTLEQLQEAIRGELWVGDSTEEIAHSRLRRTFGTLGPSRLVESITIGDTDRLVRELRNEGLAPGTINRHLSAFQTTMKWAKDRGIRKADLPKLQWQDEDEGRIRWITPAEEKRLESLLPRKEWLAVFVSIRTGFRRNEVLQLTPTSVEGGWAHLWGKTTKSGRGRSVPLSGETHQALQELFQSGMPSIDSLRYQWDKAKAAMGLDKDEDFVFHACRHTFATRAVQANVHPRVLQRLMGHQKLETTMRYMQVSDSMLADAIVRIDTHTTPSMLLSSGVEIGGLKGDAKPLSPPPQET